MLKGQVKGRDRKHHEFLGQYVTWEKPPIKAPEAGDPAGQGGLGVPFSNKCGPFPFC